MKRPIVAALFAVALITSSENRASAQDRSSFINTAVNYSSLAFDYGAQAFTAGSTTNPRSNSYQAYNYLLLAEYYANLAAQADASLDTTNSVAYAQLAYQNAYRGARFSYYAYLYSPNGSRQQFSYYAYVNAQLAAQQAYIYWVLYTYNTSIISF